LLFFFNLIFAEKRTKARRKNNNNKRKSRKTKINRNKNKYNPYSFLSLKNRDLRTNPNVISLFGVVTDSEHMCIVTEFLDGGAFMSYLKRHTFTGCFFVSLCLYVCVFDSEHMSICN
jgi:serine/threonine protein kinase